MQLHILHLLFTQEGEWSESADAEQAFHPTADFLRKDSNEVQNYVSI